MCFTFWVYWETTVVFFPYLSKVVTQSIWQGPPICGLRFQIYVWLKKEQKISNSKSERTASFFFREQSSYFCCTLSERGRYTRADTHSAILAR